MRMCWLVLWGALSLSAQQYDVVLAGGRIIDGAGSPWYYGDVGIRQGRISAIGDLRAAAAIQRVDVSGLVVTPGFIDIHNHGRAGILRRPAAENWVRQGVTTLIEGNDGSSPLPLQPFYEELRGAWPAVNMGLFVGQGTVRQTVMGLVNRPATAAELARMKELVTTAMQQGAFGLSTGLFYVPGNFSPTEEVVALARVAGQHGGMHISHMRTESDGSRDAVREVIRIGEEGRLPTQVTHHKIIGQRNWGQSEETLALIAAARGRGVDVTIDQYPYTASSTGTAALFPQWSLEGGAKSLVERLDAADARAKIKAEIVKNILENRGGGDPKNVVLASCGFDAKLAGKSLADLARDKGMAPTAENAADVAMDLQRRGGCSAIYHAIAEPDIERIMRSPNTMIASDGEIPALGAGNPHPRSYGTFARVLGVYARERHILTLEEAVHKMSGFPSQRLKLLDRGLLRLGMVADVAVFDPATVADKATFLQPHQYAVGMRHVLVGGEFVLRDGQMTAARPGQVLYGPGRRVE